MSTYNRADFQKLGWKKGECVTMDKGKRNKSKPDNRSDNVEKLQDQVQETIMNLEGAHESLHNEDLPLDQKKAIIEKNKRREESIADKRDEIRDEHEFQQRKD